MRCPIVNFHLLVLGVWSNATPGGIHKAFESPRLFKKKVLNSTQDKRSSTAWFFQYLNWCQQKLILLQRNKLAKGGVVDANSDGSSKIVLALFDDLSIDFLRLKKQIYNGMVEANSDDSMYQSDC